MEGGDMMVKTGGPLARSLAALDRMEWEGKEPDSKATREARRKHVDITAI